MKTNRIVKYCLLLILPFLLQSKTLAQNYLDANFLGAVHGFYNPAYQAINSKMEVTLYGQSPYENINIRNNNFGAALTGRLTENGLGLGIVSIAMNNDYGTSYVMQAHLNKAFKLGASRFLSVGFGITNLDSKRGAGNVINRTGYKLGAYYKGKRLEAGYGLYFFEFSPVANVYGNYNSYETLLLKYRLTLFKMLDITPTFIKEIYGRWGGVEQVGVQVMWKNKIYVGAYNKFFLDMYNIGIKLRNKFDVCVTLSHNNMIYKTPYFDCAEMVLNYKL